MVCFFFRGNGMIRTKYMTRAFTRNTPTMTISAYLRRGTNNLAQFSSFDTQFAMFAILYLLTGQLGCKYANVLSSIIPWCDGWYRCTMTITSSTVIEVLTILVPSEIAPRFNEFNTLSTSMYVAGPHLEKGTFTTSYIPTTIVPVNRSETLRVLRDLILPRGIIL